MSGVSRFDCYPSDFLNGVVGLSGDAIAAYTIIMMLQYDRGAPVAYIGRERELSVRSGLSKGRLSRAVDELIGVGKLTLLDGALFNSRTVSELKKISEKIGKNRENSASGGNATRAKWEQIRNENNEGIRPVGQPDGMPKQGPIPSPSPSPSKIRDADASLVSEGADVAETSPKKEALREALRAFGEQWNGLAENYRLPMIDEIKSGSTRERHALARLREMDAGGVAALLARVQSSPYLRGEVNGFRCSFDWIVNASNFQKVMEGNYEDRKVASIRR